MTTLRQPFALDHAQRLAHLQLVVFGDQGFDEHAIGRRGQVNAGGAEADFQQAVAFHDFFAHLDEPHAGRDRH